MHYLYKYILFFLLSIGHLDHQLEASGTIKSFLQSIFFSKETQWFDAAGEGNIEIIKNLMSKVNINAQNDYGETAIMFACCNGHENIVKLLLQNPDININIQNEDGYTALMLSSLKGHQNIVKLLLQVSAVGAEALAKEPINVNAQNKNGLTALILSICERRENIAKLLLEVPGINISAQNKTQETALMYASNFGLENIVKLLLEVPGVNFNGQNKDGWTALMFAINKGHENIVKLLLQFPGINVHARYINIYPRKFETTLSLAIAHKNEAIIKLIKDKLINQAFEAIKSKNFDRFKVIITQLMPQNIDAIFDENGHTLLDKAFACHNIELICLLLNNTKEPLELIAKLPFENLNPTSDFFKFFVNLAFGLEPFEAKDSKSFTATNCQVCSKATDKVCSGCKKVYYCSTKCQKTDWTKHKPICRLQN